MAEEALSASMKTLDLGSSEDPNASTFEHDVRATTNKAPKPLRRGNPVHGIDASKPPSEPKKNRSYRPAIQKSALGGFPNLRGLNKQRLLTESEKKGPPATKATDDLHLPSKKQGETVARTVPPTIPTSANKRRRPRRPQKGLPETHARMPTSMSPAARQEPSVDDATEEKQQLSHLYVVQAMLPCEKVIDVYSQLAKADERAVAHLGIEYGILASEISESRGLFGQAVSGGKATKRTWGTGALEILTPGGLSWIRVLPKEWAAYPESTESGAAYLALDQTNGLFVIGTYGSKDEAWDGCKKYWTQLSICSSLEDMTQWVDNCGIFHAQGKTGGKVHHWFVKRYAIL